MLQAGVILYIDTGAVDSLKALDPNWPIREADVSPNAINVRFRGQSGHGLLHCKCQLLTQSGHASPINVILRGLEQT